MENIKDGGSAFPFVVEDPNNAQWKCGMSVRQWYKGQIMSGLVSHFKENEIGSEFRWGEKMQWAVTKSSWMADLMLAEDAEHEANGGIKE